MNTVRRLYFYGLALVSLEVVIWGVVDMLRTIAAQKFVLAGNSQVAVGLSLVLVGLPIFWLHWRAAQRDALLEPEERSSRIRAIFFYAALFATLLPIVYALLALINRWLVALLTSLQAYAYPYPWYGSGQTTWDNVIAVIINAAAFTCIWMLVRADWRANSTGNFLAETRRLYRYLCVLTGLILVVPGVYNLLRFLFSISRLESNQLVSLLPGSISLLLVGVPLWIYSWHKVQSSLTDPTEQRSLLRLVVLYLISLAGMIGVVINATQLLPNLLRWILGESDTLGSFIFQNSLELGTLIAMAVMWWYYGHILSDDVSKVPDLPRRTALHRLYGYILSLIGLGITFIGLIQLVDFLIEVIFSNSQNIESLRSALSNGVACLLIGLPLWLIHWREMQREAARMDDAGDHARRSVLRKAYLYLVLFLLVIGMMAFTGQLLYLLLDTALSSTTGNLAQDSTRLLLSLVIDAALLLYHWRALRQDSRLSLQSLGNRHAAFPTLILQGPADEDFSTALVQALAKSAPHLPVAVHPIERGAPDGTMLDAKAVLLPFMVAVNPPESLRLWLTEYHGQRILVPQSVNGWHWLGQSVKTPRDRAREAAQAICQMAEGEAVRQAIPSSPWVIAGYIMGGLFSLIVLFVFLTQFLSNMFD